MIGNRIRAAALAALLASGTGCATTGGEERHARPAPHVTHVTHVTSVNVSFFYDELAPHGHWFSHGSHGWVWTPYDVPYGWRPYTHGHWIYTEYGWTWVSHWRWGWAPFHYGRWMFDPGYGWIWIPGTVWGPAWVVWRWSDDWVGWAPLPPDVAWQAGAGLRVGESHRGWDLDPAWWSFTSPHRLLDRDVRYKLEPSHRSGTLIGRTRPVADYDEVGGRPRNRGRDVGEVERLMRVPVQRFSVVEAAAPAEGEHMMDREQVRIYRPAVAPAPDARPPIVKPAARPMTPDAEQKRLEREVRQVDSYYGQEKSRMETRQRTEIRQSPPGGAEEVRRRHEAEQRALEEQKARERQVREQRIEKRIEKPAPARKTEPRPPAKPPEKQAPPREKRGG